MRDRGTRGHPDAWKDANEPRCIADAQATQRYEQMLAINKRYEQTLAKTRTKESTL
jgi:hypothetical protein